MASNEHSLLSNANIHVPKDFSIATNDTMLTKNNSGNLEWVLCNKIKTNIYHVQGYVPSTLTNYQYRNNISDPQSPFEMAQDYGSATIGAIDLDVSNIFRSDGLVIPQASTIQKIEGWLTCNVATTNYIGICKIEPVEDDSNAIPPIQIDEISITSTSVGSLNDKMWSFSETTFDDSSVAKADILFPMVKSDEVGAVLYFNMTIEMGAISGTP
jgi:hypothetical protein